MKETFSLSKLHWTKVHDSDVLQVYACDEVPVLMKATTKCTCCTRLLTAYKVGEVQVEEAELVAALDGLIDHPTMQ